jgi:S-disulfanyl-L-cysteine oxidoreductase SoxD
MLSAKPRSIVACVASAMLVWGCATTGPTGPGMAAKTSNGIPLGIIDVRTPDGRGLPAGRGSVASGRQVYATKCVACHGEEAKGGAMFGTMVGGVGSFTTNTRVLTPGSMYPYAPVLFDYVKRAMPMDRPQTLTDDEVYAVTAYLLNLNGLVPADATLDATSLAAVQMPNRNGFIVDSRPDTSATRCMTNCK